MRVEASPINPPDLGVLLRPRGRLHADVRRDCRAARFFTAAIPPRRRSSTLAARLDKSMPVGNEGRGRVVVKAGALARGPGPDRRARCAMAGGGMYAQYRCLRAADVLPLPAGATPADGASSFINPLTALGMVETMRSEGHNGLWFTPRPPPTSARCWCGSAKADGVPLVNVVRSAVQEKLLRNQGAKSVVDSTDPGFFDKPHRRAVAATGATLAFDAVGGGRPGSQILAAM